MNDLGIQAMGDKIDHRLIEQYLNTFWRESGHFVPWSDNLNFKERFTGCHFNESSQLFEQLLSVTSSSTRLPTELSELKYAQRSRAPKVFAYFFENTQTWLIGTILHPSLMGYHSYGPDFFIISVDSVNNEDRAYSVLPVKKAYQLGTLLINELSNQNGDDLERCEELVNLIQNSENNIRLYLESRQHSKRGSLKNEFRSAEQGLLFGHPFHIISKASTGFSTHEKHLYSPELEAEFKLYYFAVKPEQLIALSSTDEQPPLDPQAVEEAKVKLGRRFSDFTLHPCHPWQAKYLLNDTAFKQQLQKGAIVPLGELGSTVWPTSSVRTVFQPATDRFIKLAINIRITNFVRNNPLSELERAIDVSRLVSHQKLPDAMMQTNTNYKEEPFVILTETHCQTLDTPDKDLQSAFSILFRESSIKHDSPKVLAHLLEEDIKTGTPPLFDELIKYSNHIKSDLSSSLIINWWKRYLTISLIPLIRLYSGYGISLEAHLQNCMLSLDNGWPKTFYVRDLEGASVNRKDRCFLSNESAACYSDEEAWFRFKYYVVVNHIGHFIASLSRTTLIDESTLWSTTLDMLATSILCDKSKDSDTYLRLIHDLSHSTSLPAKMNMISRFKGHSEKPDWIDIPNPMTEAKLEVMNDSAA